MDDGPINTPPRSLLHIKPWFRFGMGIFTLNVSYFTLWFIHAQSLECLICSVLKNWSFELVLAYWYLPQNIDGETVKYFCKWHGHVDDDVFARITFRKRWWEISTLAVMSPARLLYVSRQPTVGWSGSTGCMVSLDTWAFVCGWGIPVDLNGVLLPVMSGVYLWGYDARLPQVRLSFCLCCVMVEPPFLPASRWAKAS